MRSVTLRVTTDDGRLRAVLAAFELERTADRVVLWVPVGSPGYSRRGERGGPRGSFLLPHRWEPEMDDRPWRHRDVVMVHRFDQEWSTWRWLLPDRTWQPGAYVNLERRWQVGDTFYDTEDLTLDVVVSGDGVVALKDEDELAWAERTGYYSAREAARIRGIGERAAAHVRAGGWPQPADWEAWHPPPGRHVPTLPAGWDQIGSSDESGLHPESTP